MAILPKPLIPTADLVQVVRGFLMGGADIIPGVSGGTVALILGIYDRLVTAISRVDLAWLGKLRRREWAAAAEHVDLRFLIALGSGIVLGISSLATLMHYLLEYQMQPTFAAFFGLIVASSVLVGRAVARWSLAAAVSLPAGVVFAYWLVGLPLLQNPPEGLLYLFVCGAVAICAMILPGISGAFVLLILGKYHDVTGMLRNVLHGQFELMTFVSIAVFCAGCACGLLGFSKFLKWLLGRHESVTMALLCGLMLGSLRKIWPFKVDLTPGVVEFKEKQFGNVWPDVSEGGTLAAIGIAVAAAALVLLLDAFATRRSRRND